MSASVEVPTVPFLDLTRRTRRFLAEGHAALDRIVASGQVLLGPETEAFESEFADYTGYAHVIAVASATEHSA